MKKTILPALVAACALIVAGPAYAQRGHGGQPHSPKATTVHGSAPATHGAQAHGAGSVHGGSAVHGAAAQGKVKAPKPSTHGSSTHATTTKATAKTTTKTKTTKTTSTTPTTTTTATTTLTPVQQKLEKNTNLSAKLQSLLPKGMTVEEASLGFRNLGQFVAAVNVSRNLGIPFADLKVRMTGEDPVSLGKAIQELRPGVDAKKESRAAERQAEAMVAGRS